MRFSIQRRIGRMKFSLVIGLVTRVQGVNSTLANGKHIIMWDFDEPNLSHIKLCLYHTQRTYHLPAIYIAQSHPGGGYHAYCMARLDWMKTIEIVAGTEGVDPNYVSMCAMRGHWTLRLTDKGEGLPQHVETLLSNWPDDVGPSEFKSWVDYEVWSKKRILTLGKRGL